MQRTLARRAAAPDLLPVEYHHVVFTLPEQINEHGQVHYDWQHYIPLLQKKPGALRNGAPFADLPGPLQ